MVEYQMVVYDAPVWTVYIHVNRVNGKKYVGITRRSMKIRWQGGHGYDGQLFGKAIKKYGRDNFDHIIMGTNYTETEAKLLEIVYIKSLHSNISDGLGYNVTIGGDGSNGTSSARRIDITGQRFGKLVALERTRTVKTENGHYRSIWFCKCDCGNYCEATYDSLIRYYDDTQSGTGSCGCMSSRNFGTPKPNTFYLYDNFGIGKTNNGFEFIFDAEDYEKIKEYTWCVAQSKYVATGATDTHQRYRIEGIILDVPTYNVDKLRLKYRNGNSLDVRKENLIVYLPDNRDVQMYDYFIHNIAVKGFKHYKNDTWNIGIKKDGCHLVHGLENAIIEYDQRYGTDLLSPFLIYKGGMKQ